jgi:hypothetical protein
MRSLFPLLLMTALLAPAATLFAQDEDVEAPFDPASVVDDEFGLPIDQRTGEQIAGLIAQLGSPVFTERQGATNTLISIGATAFAPLRDAYRRTDDLEVRLRIEEIVHTAYLVHHVFSQNGFLGIQMSRTMPSHADDARIPEGRYGIRLASVNPDTGAERAGLLKDDIVVALDGQPLAGSQQDAFPRFAETIRSRGPGAQLNLKVLRGDQTVEIQPTLGPVPLERFEQVNGIVPQVRETNRRFDVWWPKYFLETRD